MSRMLAAALLGLAASCSTLVAPRTILAEDALELDDKERLLARWEAGIARANAFLASAHNQDLPPGEFELLNDGMVLRTGDGRLWQVQVRCTTWGSMAAAFGYPAQERSWGFVVGARGDGPAVEANTFFRGIDGRARDADGIAQLILHEVAHQVHEVGTLGFRGGLHYYWHGIFSSWDEHPDEQTPIRVDRAFRTFASGRPPEAPRP